MKRITFRFLILSGVLSSIMFSLLSCSFEISEKKRINDPDIKASSNGFIVTLKNSNQDTLYVNIFRQDVSSTNLSNEPENSDDPITNLGIVFPYTKSNSTNNNTFTFEDNYVVIGRKYRYYARLYSETDGYTYTNWTQVYKAQTGLASGTSRFYYGIPSGTKFIYDAQAKNITINGSVSIPDMIEKAEYDRYFKPALVFESNKGARAFQIESVDNNTVIYLASLLPVDFQDTDIKFLGLIGQKIETYTLPNSDETKNQRIVWTKMSPPIAFCYTDGSTITNQTIHLKSEYGDSGFDYSD